MDVKDFPMLYNVDKKGVVRNWLVSVVGASIKVSHGKLGGKQQYKFTTVKGKNIGRANETTAFEQACSEARSKWQKKKDFNFYRESIEEAKHATTEGVMLASNYVNKPHLLKFPCYGSTKLDGIRCKVVLEDDKLHFISRGNTEFPYIEHIAEVLYPLMKEYNFPVLDGELYIHGRKLQDILSCIEKHNELTPQLTYQVFDVPNDKPWEDRLDELQTLRLALCYCPVSHVNVVNQVMIANSSVLEDFLEVCIDNGYEGVMMRNTGSTYLYQNKRSSDLLKYKRMQDSEGKIISCTEDKNGNGLYTVEWDDGCDVVTFKLSMNGSKDITAYEECMTHIGDWVCFKYQDVTKDGKPTFARGLYYRECDEDGNPVA